MTKSEYAEYLKTEHWQTTRTGALERAGHRCQVCNGDQYLQVHHRTYERLRRELPADLTVLCRGCHKLFHDRLGLATAPKPRSGRKRRDDLAWSIIGHKNWSEMAPHEQEGLRRNVLGSLLNDKNQPAHTLSGRVGAKSAAVGSCCVDLRRMGLVYKKGNRWAPTRKAATWLEPEDGLAARRVWDDLDAELDGLLERAA